MAREEGALMPPRLTPSLLAMLSDDNHYSRSQHVQTWVDQQGAGNEDEMQHWNAYDDGRNGIVRNAQYRTLEENDAYDRGMAEFVALWNNGKPRRL